MPERWTMVDTFSGIGGFSLAAEWTGRIQPIQFIEIDPWCRRVLAKHWPGVPIHDDIKTFLADPMRAGGRQECGSPSRDEGADEGWTAQHDYLVGCRGEGRARLDLITGGFPCQPFSQAGKQRGAHDDRYLWPELARIVAALRPRWCLFENVFGIVNMAGGLERVWADLEAEDYEVGAVVIPAAAVGAPHKRDRVWIVATDMADAGREGRATGRVRGGPAPQREALNLGVADGGGVLNVADAAARGVRRGSASGHPGQPAFGGEDAAYPDGEGEPIGTVDGGAGCRQLRSRDDADTEHTGGVGSSIRRRLHDHGRSRPVGEKGDGEALGSLGVQAHGLPGRMDGRFTPRPFGPDWEDGIPRVTTHEEDRVSKLKALGNSIVPQVAYELMLMMLAVDDEAN